MKKLVLSLMLVAFAVVTVQAGEGQCAGGGCCKKDAKKETKEKQTVASPKGGEQAKR